MNAEEFKAARKQMKLSARRLARLLSDPDGDSPPVSLSTIYRWELGRRQIPSPAIAAMRLLLARHQRWQKQKAAREAADAPKKRQTV